MQAIEVLFNFIMPNCQQAAINIDPRPIAHFYCKAINRSVICTGYDVADVRGIVVVDVTTE